MSQETTLPLCYRCTESLDVTQRENSGMEPELKPTGCSPCVEKEQMKNQLSERTSYLEWCIFGKLKRSLPQILQALCRLTKEGTEFTLKLSKYFFNLYLFCIVPNSPLSWSSFCFLGKFWAIPPSL